MFTDKVKIYLDLSSTVAEWGATYLLYYYNMLFLCFSFFCFKYIFILIFEITIK